MATRPLPSALCCCLGLDMGLNSSQRQGSVLLPFGRHEGRYVETQRAEQWRRNNVVNSKNEKESRKAGLACQQREHQVNIRRGHAFIHVSVSLLSDLALLILRLRLHLTYTLFVHYLYI